jgi:hypothetical protein
MTTEGWIFFALGWGAIGGLTFWCFHRLLRKPPAPPGA